jgi:K+-sensing histidine kinase KdpD
MESHFASPERSTPAVLAEEIKSLTNNSLVDGLMNAANSLFAILNEHRQIVAINESFLKMMGVEDAVSVLGLRNGEYVRCVHADEMPGGCGTSSFCSTCGAVVAIIASMELREPVERVCAITVERDNKEVELFFQVRCTPVEIDGQQFILMFLQDVSLQQQCANMERTFFHDISNVLMALMGKGTQLNKLGDHPQIADVQKLITRLVQEFSVQKSLANSISHTYQPLYCDVSVNGVLSSLEGVFSDSHLTVNKKVEFVPVAGDVTLVSDECLVRRIVENMISNALEASADNETVRVYIEPDGGSLSFCVWNRRPIPEDIGRRIFQRNFTTKDGLGHGLGTFSMKFFGEQVLGGVVGFTSSEEQGTEFRLTLMQQ